MMTSTLPVTHAILEAGALAAEIWPDYHLPVPVEVTLYRFGLNDHYLVTTPEGQYIIRVYHHGWRTAEDITYELAVVRHLHARGVPVCAPIIRKDGSDHRYVPAPEGPRAVVIFPYAEGQIPDGGKEGEYRAYGRALGLIHRNTGDFSCASPRFTLDLPHLLDQPLAAMLPFLRHRPDDVTYVQAVAHALRERLAAHVDGLEWGFCHGDFHGGNAHVDADGTVRVFDFDCCGLGWRAYDLAVCLWGGGSSEEKWAAFCAGYQEIYPIPDPTRQAIPWFVIARQLWLLGLHTGNSPRKMGTWFLHDRYFDHHLGTLRKLVAQHTPDLLPLESYA